MCLIAKRLKYMAEEANIAPAEETKQTETPAETTVAPKEEPVVEAKPTETVGEALQTSEPAPAPETKPEVRMVPESVVIQLKKDMKELKKQVTSGDKTVDEVDEALQALGEEHNVDPVFLQKLTKVIRSKTQTEFEEKLEKAMEPAKELSAAQKKAEMDKTFDEYYDKTLEALPEFKDIANKEVIRALAFRKENANKTFQQILEDSYGHLVQGKRTFDGSKPGSGKDITEIDFEKARTDTEYFKQIMSNPTLKAKYNESLTERNKF